jgi:hypothetical protein
MFAFFRRIGCLSLILLFIFIIMAMYSGGDTLRWLGEKAGGIVEKTTVQMAEEADKIKKEVTEQREKIKKWLRKGKLFEDK